MHVEDHRQPLRRQVRVRLGDDDLVPGAAGREPGARQAAHLGQLRAAGEHDQPGVDVAPRRCARPSPHHPPSRAR